MFTFLLTNPGSPAKGGQAAGVYPPRAGEDDRLKYSARNDNKSISTFPQLSSSFPAAAFLRYPYNPRKG